METIRGRTSLALDLDDFKSKLKNHNHAVLDLGTGDGRFVRTLASRHPDWFVIGVDACRENLREHSSAKQSNMLFVIASAQELPAEFLGSFSQITIYFPWGSLLDGLLACQPGLMHGLACVVRPDAQIEICLNAGALAEAGQSLESGTERVYENLSRLGWTLRHPHPMDIQALAQFPTTWAKRLAFGRDPRAIRLQGRYP